MESIASVSGKVVFTDTLSVKKFARPCSRLVRSSVLTYYQIFSSVEPRGSWWLRDGNGFRVSRGRVHGRWPKRNEKAGNEAEREAPGGATRGRFGDHLGPGSVLVCFEGNDVPAITRHSCSYVLRCWAVLVVWKRTTRGVAVEPRRVERGTNGRVRESFFARLHFQPRTKHARPSGHEPGNA